MLHVCTVLRIAIVSILFIWTPAPSDARLTALVPAEMAAVIGQAGSVAVGARAPMSNQQVQVRDEGSATDLIPGLGGMSAVGSFLRLDGIEVSGFELRTLPGYGRAGQDVVADAIGLLGLAGMFSPLGLLPVLGSQALSFDLAGTQIHFDQLAVAGVRVNAPQFGGALGPSLGALQINDFTLTIRSGTFGVSQN